MFKTILRICAAFILCALLVYAPELYAAVSAPYKPAVSERILLRVILCTQDTDSADALFDALNIYMKNSPTVHLRVTRADAQQLFALPDPQPDVFIFSDSLLFDAARFFSPLNDRDHQIRHTTVFSPNQGETLLCGISRDSNNKDAAFALLNTLQTASSAVQTDAFAP